MRRTASRDPIFRPRRPGGPAAGTALAAGLVLAVSLLAGIRGDETPRRIPPSNLAEGVTLLSSGDSYDDFASLACGSDGSLYAAYAAYYDGHDQVRLHRRLEDGQWSTRSIVPLAEAEADVWMPQLAMDGSGRLWVIWSEQTGRRGDRSGNWDLFARAREGDRWGPLVRLSEDPRPDIHPHVATGAGGTLAVVWQAHPDATGDIRLSRCEGGEWSRPLAVTSGPESDWFPRVAADGRGVLWVAFDSYRRGDYDVFLVRVEGDQVGPPIPVATSKYYEAHASVASTPDGTVWIAWERGGYHWGKDQGYWLRLEERNVGSTLGSGRSVHVAAYREGRLLEAPPVAACLPEGGGSTALPDLAAAPDGRLWLRFRRQKQASFDGRRRRWQKLWTENTSYLTARGWSPARELPESAGRISVFSRILAAPDGTVHLAYSGDQRRLPDHHQAVHDRVLVACLPRPEEPPSFPELGPLSAPAPPEGAREWDAARESRQVAAIREYRAVIGGEAHRIVRGDLHRHTELSWDVGPGNDGSYLDFYRYMIDVAAMDFGALTDHQGGGHYAYHWWLTEKSADMYYLPPRFVPLYGYERSVRFPDGHRNIFHSYRGVPVFPFQLRLDQKGEFPGVGTGAVVENDTQLLYEYLSRTGGVAISHTSGTNMGTDWRDNDAVIEPVVEIYQGARNSYEALGGPRVHDVSVLPATQAPGGYRPAGMVWNAWKKGYRLGTITSSDHGSTHISYALLYTPENDREPILRALRERRAYGATDNIIVEFRAGEHFMGAEFTPESRPELLLRARGTAPIARVDLIRNNEYIYTAGPERIEVEIRHTDMSPGPGVNYYYWRIQQTGGEIAWTSPIWIRYRTD